MNKPCVGFLEISSIAIGIKTADSLLKKATVRVLVAETVSSGKYIIMFDGEVEEVKSSLREGTEIADKALIDSFLITNIYDSIIKAIHSDPAIENLEAVGIIETSTCASCILALDTSLKTADVNLLKIHLAKGIAGKAYFIINGEVGEVEEALNAGIRLAKSKNALIEKVIIPYATEELLQAFNPPLTL